MEDTDLVSCTTYGSLIERRGVPGVEKYLKVKN